LARLSNDDELAGVRTYSLTLFSVLVFTHLAVGCWALKFDLNGDEAAISDWHTNIAFVVAFGLAMLAASLVVRQPRATDRFLLPALGVDSLKTALGVYGALTFGVVFVLRGFLLERIGVPEGRAVGISLIVVAAMLCVWGVWARRRMSSAGRGA
jgi:hypothetical protein